MKPQHYSTSFELDEGDISALREHSAELNTVKKLLHRTVSRGKNACIKNYLSGVASSFENWVATLKVGACTYDANDSFYDIYDNVIVGESIDNLYDSGSAEMRFILKGFRTIISEAESYLFGLRCACQ